MTKRQAMIVAAQPEAAEAGAIAMRAGGNAVDAVVAAAFAQGVADPQMCGVGGFGAMQILLPHRGIHTVLEFFARAPLSASAEMWADKFVGQTRDGFIYQLSDNSNDLGYGAIGTPGTVAGLCEALSRFGTKTLPQIMNPAIELAHEGVMVRPYMHYHWSLQHGPGGPVDCIDKLAFTETGRKVYFDADGSLRRPGQKLSNPDMARTLERIAAGGADSFYRGDIAKDILENMRAAGGPIAAEDLASYRVRERAPIWGSYRGMRISSNPPPAGGLTLLEMLHIVEHFDFDSIRHNSVDHLKILAEAMKWAMIDKEEFVGDPDYVEIPGEKLLSEDYTRSLAARIRQGIRADVARADAPFPPPDTTVVCAVDKDGGAVALTHTLGVPSGVITEGLGFMYNGCMSGFDPRPGRAASIAPGKSRGSAMAPTMLFDGDNVRTIMAAPGGTHIVPAIMQVISNLADFGMDITDAIAAPRIAALSNVVEVSNRIERSTTAALEALGYPIARSYMSYAFAAVHGITVNEGRVRGCADPQRDGVAILVD